jgi:hypothetical protein
MVLVRIQISKTKIMVLQHSLVIWHLLSLNSLSRWRHGLRRGSAADGLLGLRVRIPPGTWLSLSLSLSLSCECHVEVSGMSRSLVQRSPTECVLFKCDLQTSIMRRPRPTQAVEALGGGGGGGGLSQHHFRSSSTWYKSIYEFFY